MKRYMSSSLQTLRRIECALAFALGRLGQEVIEKNVLARALKQRIVESTILAKRDPGGLARVGHCFLHHS
jgi:hypothetical protein